MRNKILRASMKFFLCYTFIVCAGCEEFPTIRLTSDLQRQLKQGEFERIYDESALELRRAIGKQEFVDKLKNAVAVMRQADAELNWRIGQANGDVYGMADRGLKFYAAERVLGSDQDGVYVHLQFIEEKKGVVKLAQLEVHDLSTKPESTLSIP